MDCAESELVVPSGHGARQNPKAIQEVRRILVLNAEQRGLQRAHPTQYRRLFPAPRGKIADRSLVRLKLTCVDENYSQGQLSPT